MSKSTKETSEIVPGKEAGEQESDALNELKGLNELGVEAVDVAKRLGAPLQASAEGALSLKPLMHTGCAGECAASSSMLPRGGQGRR